MNAPILDHMSALSDQTRCRMLLLLERHELTVSELCAVLQMPQSSVSRHLKTLADDDWVASRRDGTSRFYSMPADDLDAGATRLWPLIREQVAATSAAGQDDRRLRGVLARRRAKSQEFFANAAAGWDRLRQDLYGDTFYLSAVLGPDRPQPAGRRSRVRHRTAHGNGGALRAPGDCGGRVDGHARRGPRAARRRDHQRRVPEGRARVAADRRRRARRGGAVAGAALLAGAAEGALGSGPGDPAGRARARRGHAAARARGVSAADGPRVARVFGQADDAVPHQRGIYRRAGAEPAGQPGRRADRRCFQRSRSRQSTSGNSVCRSNRRN